MTAAEYRDTQATPKMTFVTMLTSAMALATWTMMIVAAEQLLIVVAFGALVALLVGGLVVFSRLRVTIDASGVEVSFSGLVGRRVAYDEIEAVEVRGYDWQEFFGWGLRWSLTDNRAVAYSLLGVPGSVRLSLRSGETVVITCRAPERTREAIEARLEGSDGAA